MKRLLGLIPFLKAEREARYTLSCKVQADDVHLSSERTGGKVGRCSENKVAFVAAGTVYSEGLACLCAVTQYCGTFGYRFNRRFDLKTLCQRLLIAAAQCGAHSQRSIRSVAEVHCY